MEGLEIDQKTVLDSTGALSLQKIPESMLCIGGGYIGLELTYLLAYALATWYVSYFEQTTLVARS